MQDQWIVILEPGTDYVTYYGPFATAEEALAWGKRLGNPKQFSIDQIKAPDAIKPEDI